MVGSYCHECGQADSVQRYSVATIGREIYEQFRKIDVLTTFRTFRKLAVEPGNFVRSYLAGQRVGYLAPIKYFFYSFALQVLVGGWLFWLTSDRAIEELSHIDFRVEITSLISTGMWGVLWAGFYRKSGLNIVECMVAALFFVAQTNFFGIIIQLVTLPAVRAELISKEVLEILELIIPIAYSFYFARQLFQDKLIWLILKQLLLTILYLLLIVIIFTIGFLGKAVIENYR